MRESVVRRGPGEGGEQRFSPPHEPACRTGREGLGEVSRYRQTPSQPPPHEGEEPFLKVVVIVGPTASGKTKLAVALARRFGGEIVSADSRQVYRGMDIGTGKDLAAYGARSQKSKGKRQTFNSKVKSVRVPYHLIDVASPRRQFTVAEYQRRAYRAVEEIFGRGKLPIVCGGTGLYVDAIVRGLQFPKPRITNQAVRRLRARLQRLRLPQLLARLKHVDPVTYALIDRRNRRRVERAVEISYATGRPKSAQQLSKAPPYHFLQLGVTRPKAILHRRIARRLRARLRQGMVAEVRRLHRQGVSWKRLDAFGLEYRWVSRWLRGEVDWPMMEASLLREIKQFARRQMVWWKRNPRITWISSPTQAISQVRNFL